MSFTCASPPSFEGKLSLLAKARSASVSALWDVGAREANDQEEPHHGRRSGSKPQTPWYCRATCEVSWESAWRLTWFHQHLYLYSWSPWYNPCELIRHWIYHTRKTSRDRGGTAPTRQALHPAHRPSARPHGLELCPILESCVLTRRSGVLLQYWYILGRDCMWARFGVYRCWFSCRDHDKNYSFSIGHRGCKFTESPSSDSRVPYRGPSSEVDKVGKDRSQLARVEIGARK